MKICDYEEIFQLVIVVTPVFYICFEDCVKLKKIDSGITQSWWKCLQTQHTPNPDAQEPPLVPPLFEHSSLKNCEKIFSLKNGTMFREMGICTYEV